MHSDEQVEYWIAMMKGISKDDSLSKDQKESDLDDLEEQINFADSTHFFFMPFRIFMPLLRASCLSG
jgi:hypothetical protein